MKSVLASFKPQYCELIASGKKTVEIRKTRPKLEVPFKVYMYCTSAKKLDENLWTAKNATIGNFADISNGKVIGEFVCDRIEFLGGITTTAWKYLAGDKHEYHKKLVVECACLSEAEALKYGNHKSCYGWHISDLVIYDKPKELSEFYSSRKFENCHRGVQKYNCDACFDCGLTRPPQSWCYVEEA